MQHLYGSNANENVAIQHGKDVYHQSSDMYQHSFHSSFQYQYENPSVSPRQSPHSDVEETSSSLQNRMNNKNAKSPNKKKKQTKKKRKDPNEPQKPVSPYALFFRDTQNDIKKKLANPSFGEISKVVAHMWENIEPEVKEQYKNKAAAAKKEYLKKLAAYRAVQISHQTPNIHQVLHQTSLSFSSHPTQQTNKQYQTGPIINNNNQHLQSHNHHHHSMQQYRQSSSTLQHPTHQYHNFHYVHPYYHEASNAYYSNRSGHISNPSYSTYDSNNNYSDYQNFGLLRPMVEPENYASYYAPSAIDNEHMKINETLLNNLNPSGFHYTMGNGCMENPYDLHDNNTHQDLTENRNDDRPELITNLNEKNIHWNHATCSSIQW